MALPGERSRDVETVDVADLAVESAGAKKRSLVELAPQTGPGTETTLCAKQRRMEEPGQVNIEELFQYCRGSLDSHHDIRERVIKAGRDVTNASKKIIFALQSVRLDQENKVVFTESINDNIEKNYKIIQDRLKSLVGDIGVSNHGCYSKYQGQISGGIQEFIEAISFEYYLRESRMVTLNEVQTRVNEWVSNDNGKIIPITIEDFILGLFDLTGELMRFVISNLKPTQLAIPPICTRMMHVLREFRNQLDQLDLSKIKTDRSLREWDKKRSVFEDSLKKVEFGVYGVVIRTSEGI